MKRILFFAVLLVGIAQLSVASLSTATPAPEPTVTIEADLGADPLLEESTYCKSCHKSGSPCGYGRTCKEARSKWLEPKQ